MIRNLSFLVIAISLVVYIYYSEELAEQESYEQQVASEQIYNAKESGALVSFKGRNFSFSKKGESFYSKDKLPIDQTKVKNFFTQLLNIKIIRVLTNSDLKDIDQKLLIDEQPPKLSFKFENGSMVMSLGKQTQFSKNFYVKINKNKSQNSKWAIASYRAPYSARVNTKDAHRSSAPYQSTRALFDVKKENLLNLKVLQSFKTINKVKVLSKRNKKYAIDFNNLKTIPSAPNGIEEVAQRIDNYKDLLIRLEALDIYREGSLANNIGELEVNESTLKFYSLRDGARGHYLKLGDYIYKLSAEHFRVLFEPQQYFWKKNLGLSGSESYEIFNSSDELVIKSNLGVTNTWTQLLMGEAHWVGKATKEKFEAKYKIKIDSKLYLLRGGNNGVELLDVSNQVIFHFLEKIK